MIDIVLKEVSSFAFKKHYGQIRPNKKKEPKTVHINQVAALVKKAQGSLNAIAAAYLHDTVEDTDTTLEEICENFGNEVTILVNELTDPLEFKAMELSIRKQKQADRIQIAHNDTKIVKIADQISNVASVYTDPPINWDNETCLKYAMGAKKIVNCCTGANQYLEDKFNIIYMLCITKYSI